jgi:hypothetical protein
MTKMPIARSVVSRGAITTPLGKPVADPVKLCNFIREATHFEVQVASDLYWCGSQNDYSIASDFGPLRLPYPSVWMEWAHPAEGIVEGKRAQLPPLNVGCYLTETPYDEGVLITAVSLVAAPGISRPPGLTPMRITFQVDEDGRYIGGSNGVRCFCDTVALDSIAINNYRHVAMNQLNVACLALNLINCKNVTTEVAGELRVPRSGSQKRRKEPRIEYRTIRLPGSPCGGEATGENEGIMPLHRVRGHFKKFTEAAPLLGKHTGTYWWGWQVRGKKENGEIISDYQLRDAS